MGIANITNNILTDSGVATSSLQNTISLTTTGSSGASTFASSVLNVPTYTLSGLGGVPTSRTITINGTTLDLSADRTFTVSGGVTGSGTTGNIPKFTGTSALGNSIMSESGSVITISGTITETSALRYKENIETIDNALDSVLKMRGVTYNKIGNDNREVGVIAEEVYDVIPELITFEDGEINSVSYSRTVGVLIEAIKEQQKQIEELKSLLVK
jgi:hypothetical protein